MYHHKHRAPSAFVKMQCKCKRFVCSFACFFFFLIGLKRVHYHRGQKQVKKMSFATSWSGQTEYQSDGGAVPKTEKDSFSPAGTHTLTKSSSCGYC